MQAYSCILCKNSDREFINIYYKNGRNSAKDDMLELCGKSIEQYLGSDDLACSKCIRALDNAAELKRQVYKIIIALGPNRRAVSRRSSTSSSDSEAVTNNGYGDINAYPATPTRPSYKDLSPQNYANASPSSLLVVSRTVPYDQRSEIDFEEANNKYQYYDRITPALDREIQTATFRGRRRKRGHKWTRQKGSGSRSRSAGARFRFRDQPSRNSHRSTHSRASRATTASRKQQQLKEAKIMHTTRIIGDLLTQDDALGQFTRVYLNKHSDIIDDDLDQIALSGNNQIIRTRYASALRDKIIADYQNYIFECPVISCKMTEYSLEKITEHRVREHNEMAMFWCEQCKFSFLTQEHLDKHKELHYQKFLSYCIYCAEEFRNKREYEEHLNEHLIHSFPCIYCDKFFLRKQLCETHIREEHPGRKKKIKRIKPQSILDRIDKHPDQRAKPDDWYAQNKQKEFVVKILRQPGQPEESCSVNEEDLLDLNGEDAKSEECTEESSVPDSDTTPSSTSSTETKSA